MRCKACNFRLSDKDLYVDDELCGHCLGTIRSDLSYAKKGRLDDPLDGISEEDFD